MIHDSRYMSDFHDRRGWSVHLFDYSTLAIGSFARHRLTVALFVEVPILLRRSKVDAPSSRFLAAYTWLPRKMHKQRWIALNFSPPTTNENYLLKWCITCAFFLENRVLCSFLVCSPQRTVNRFTNTEISFWYINIFLFMSRYMTILSVWVYVCVHTWNS